MRIEKTEVFRNNQRDGMPQEHIIHAKLWWRIMLQTWWAFFCKLMLLQRVAI